MWVFLLQVGGIYVRLFLKDPKFPLRNPKRFLEGILDQYVAAAAATHGKGGVPTNPELPLLLSAGLVSLLRAQPLLADHVGHLGYVPKLVAAMANEGRREVMSSSGQVVIASGLSPWEVDEDEGVGGDTAQGRVRLSCLRVLHQLAASTTCAEAMATPGCSTAYEGHWLARGKCACPRDVETSCCCWESCSRCSCSARSKVGLVEVLFGLLDWRAGGRNGLCEQMKWNESEASVGRVLAVEILRAFAGEGAHSAKVQDILTSSDSAAAGVAGLIEWSSASVTYALPAPSARSGLLQVPMPNSPLDNTSEESLSNGQ